MSENMIEMKNIQKHYGDFQALTDVNFNVKKGEIVVVCGQWKQRYANKVKLLS